VRLLRTKAHVATPEAPAADLDVIAGLSGRIPPLPTVVR